MSSGLLLEVVWVCGPESSPGKNLPFVFYLFTFFRNRKKGKNTASPSSPCASLGKEFRGDGAVTNRAAERTSGEPGARPRGPLLCQPSRRCAFRKLRLERGTSDLLHVPLPSEPAVYDFISTLVKCSLKKLPASVYI